MRKSSIYILGAGPAGLSAAYTFSKRGENTTLIEKDSKVGGLSKSIFYNNFILDYGAHYLDTDNEFVSKLFDEVLASEQLVIKRQTRLYWRNQYFSYPPQLTEIFSKIEFEEILIILFSYFQSRVKRLDNSSNYEEFLVKKYGKKLYSIFFKDYLEKIWGLPCSKLSTDTVSGRANDTFKIWTKVFFHRIKNLYRKDFCSKVYDYKIRYPKRGLGQFYDGIAEYLLANSQKILLNYKVIEINHENYKISSVVLENLQTNQLETHECKAILSSIPLPLLLQKLSPILPKNILELSSSFRYRSTILVYLIVEGDNLFSEHSIYINDPKILLVRVTNFANWSPYTLPNSYQTPICCEYWDDLDGLSWRKTDDELLHQAEHELRIIKLIKDEMVSSGFVIRLPRTHPVYTVDYLAAKLEVMNFLNQFDNLYLIGRGGSFNYHDQDKVLLMGKLAAENILRNLS